MDHDLTLKAAAPEARLVTEAEFDRVVYPQKNGQTPTWPPTPRHERAMSIEEIRGAWIERAHMTLGQRSNLILAVARVLYFNGQSTDEILASAARFGENLVLDARIMPRWGRAATSCKGMRRRTDLHGCGRSNRSEHGPRGFRNAGNRGNRRWSLGPAAAT